MCFFVVLRDGFCMGYFVIVPLDLTYLHCLQHSFFEHLFNLYCLFVNTELLIMRINRADLSLILY